MRPTLSVIVLAGDAEIAFPAVELVRRSCVSGVEIVVLCGRTVPEQAAARLQSIWRPETVRCLVAADGAPGAARNQGLAAATGDVLMFLEGGDTIDAAYPAAALDVFVAQPAVDFVTAWARPPFGDTLVKPDLCVGALLGGRDALPGPTLFRRSIWASTGGFDEQLGAWEWNDFWLRAIVAGGRGHVLEQPLIGYQPSRHSAWRRRLDADRAGEMRAFFENHAALFEAHIADALCDREDSMRELASSYHRLLRRRDRLVKERSSVSGALADASDRLRSAGLAGIDWGGLRRTTPVSRNWGYERGAPLDRYYIERFLEAHAADVQGTVLEIQEADYTRRFGRERVTQSDVIDVAVDNPRANLNGDLRDLHAIASNTYDCFILTQTVHVVNDMTAVLREAVRVLKPGGVLLATLPCASRVCLEYGPDGDFWRVTEAGARELFRQHFPTTHLSIQAFGNALTTAAFTAGLAVHEISAEEFEACDPFNPTLVGVRAAKPGGAPVVMLRRESSATILLYHRVADAPHDVHELCVSPSAFRDQMRHLGERYQPVPLAQLARAAAEGWLPERAVAITFDDGYLDNLTTASPILCELGLPATFFVTTAGLDSGGPFWWDVLESVFLGGAVLPPRLTMELSGGTREYPTGSPEDRRHSHWELYHLVRTADAPRRRAVMARIVEWADGLSEALPRAMNASELRQLSTRPGHSIGGHGGDHLSYSAQPADVVGNDVGSNRRALERAIGRMVTSFAYPFGDFDEQALEIVEDAGYRAAVTCEPAHVRPGTHPLRLPRIAVGAAANAPDLFERLLQESAAQPSRTR